VVWASELAGAVVETAASKPNPTTLLTLVPIEDLEVNAIGNSGPICSQNGFTESQVMYNRSVSSVKLRSAGGRASSTRLPMDLRQGYGG
jgi:hypothetical protein